MKQIIIAHLYQPSSAATNRILAFAKSFTELGKQVTLVLGSEDNAPLPVLNEVNIVEVKAPFHFLLVPTMSHVIKRLYSRNDTAIIVYGSPLMCLFLPNSQYNIFYECTEVPFYGHAKGWTNRFKESIKRCLSRRATGMFVISEALKGYFTKQGIKSITVINMFVDSTRFNIDIPKPDNKYIAYCGTVSLFKDGVDCLIKAFQIFFLTHPNYRLLIIGKFQDDEAERQVLKLTQELNLQDAIDYSGLIAPDMMPALLKSATMLALARPNNRQAQYGFPTKLGEYLATGNPVVVTDVGEIGLFLKDGVNCRMAEASNPKDFAEKMSWVAEHEEEARLLGEQGRLLTMSEFSALEQSRKALSFMESLMK